MIDHQAVNGEANAIDALGLGEMGLEESLQDGNGHSPRQMGTPPRPRWGLLYAVLPLTLLLFALADLVNETSGWRPVTESIAVLVIFGALAAWVRFNQSALAASQGESEAPSIKDLRKRRAL